MHETSLLFILPPSAFLLPALFLILPLLLLQPVHVFRQRLDRFRQRLDRLPLALTVLVHHLQLFPEHGPILAGQPEVLLLALPEQDADQADRGHVGQVEPEAAQTQAVDVERAAVCFVCHEFFLLSGWPRSRVLANAATRPTPFR
jgi:hypothetical protein